MYRKAKKSPEPMPKKQLQRITKAFKKNGGMILMNDEVSKYLSDNDAEGVTYNENTILLVKNPGRAAVFEELIHSAQYRQNKNDGTKRSRIMCEIEAQEKLIKNSKANQLTQIEVEQTQKALEYYKEELKKLS